MIPRKDTPGTNDLDFDGLLVAITEGLDGIDKKTAVKTFKAMFGADTTRADDLDFNDLLLAIAEGLDGIDETTAVETFKSMFKTKLWRTPAGYRVQWETKEAR